MLCVNHKCACDVVFCSGTAKVHNQPSHTTKHTVAKQKTRQKF